MYSAPALPARHRAWLFLTCLLGMGLTLPTQAFDMAWAFQKSGRPMQTSPDKLDLRDPMFHVSKAPSSKGSAIPKSMADANLFARLAPSVVLIIGKKANGNSLGSGSVISEDGLILTNWHVIDGVDNISVMFYPADGDLDKAARIRAQLIKVDQIADLALLRLNSVPPGLKPLRFGQIDSVRVGMDVHAIGHPTGEAWSYTKGLVSQIRAKFRWHDEQVATVIQTQTPINPGNSGGPLLDDDGLIVGVNTFMNKNATLINYAVGVDDVRNFLGRSEHRYLTRQPFRQEAAASTCQSRIIDEERDDAKATLYASLDFDCDNRADAIKATPDDVRKEIVMIIDTDRNGKGDMYVFDRNRDGKWDISFRDTNNDGIFDQIGQHPDGALMPTSTTPYSESRTADESADRFDPPNPVGNWLNDEPSEAVMRRLVQTRFDQKANRLQKISESCASGQVNAMEGLLCLGIAPMAAMGVTEPVQITRFRKLACTRASGKPGFICDYLIETSHQINQMLGNLADRDGAGQARFLNTGDSWYMYGER